LKTLDDAKDLVVQSSFFMDRNSDGTRKIAEMLLQLPQSREEILRTPLRLLPGSIVTKTGDRQYLVQRPARYTATPSLRTATVMKVPKASSGFEMVRA